MAYDPNDEDATREILTRVFWAVVFVVGGMLWLAAVAPRAAP